MSIHSISFAGSTLTSNVLSRRKQGQTFKPVPEKFDPKKPSDIDPRNYSHWVLRELHTGKDYKPKRAELMKLADQVTAAHNAFIDEPKKLAIGTYKDAYVKALKVARSILKRAQENGFQPQGVLLQKLIEARVIRTSTKPQKPELLVVGSDGIEHAVKVPAAASKQPDPAASQRQKHFAS